MERIKARAKRAAKESDNFLERWWSKKYGLPAEHELFQNRTPGDLLLEMYTDWADEMVRIEAQLPDATGEESTRLRERYKALAEILGESGTSDDWEAMMEAGSRPDLSRYERGKP